MTARKSPAAGPGGASSLVVRVERMVHGGNALARTDEGVIVLVSGAVPGEKVVVEARQQRGVLLGTVTEVVEGSPDRVPAAAHPGLDYSFMTYPRQLLEKRAVVADALARARRQAAHGPGPLEAGEAPPVVPAPAEWGYRSTVQPATGLAGLGYRRPGTGEVVLLPGDPTATPAVNAAWERIVAEGVHRAPGTVEVVIRANDAGEALVALVSRAPARALLEAAHALVRGGVSGVAHAPFDPRGRFRSGAERLAGVRTILQRYGAFELTVNAVSFAQPNPAAAGLLYARLAGWAGAGESAAELYAGGGAISFHLAPRFGRVMAYEVDRGAVARGRRDAERLGVANVEFVRQDAREVRFAPGVDLVVVDPPRAGLPAPAREALAASKVRRLLYVSCDAATWARDVADLERHGFTLARFEPHDFYPQTHHVELLSELTRD